jgi:uncharacterized protein (TIGR02453 family)
MGKQYFTTEVFAFLKELEQNNDKSWWEANKQRYIDVIRDPAKEFIADFEPRLHKLSPHFVADTRTNGGSLMRPYRDTRFSGDKTPYKTNVGIQFRHEAGKDVHAPGFYIHFQPGQNFAGVGMWHPETAVARRVRQHIYDHPDQWKKATRSDAFLDDWDLDPDEDEMLKRVPKEFDPDFEFADELRMKSFIAGARLDQGEVTSSSFDEDIASRFATANDFTGFLTDAVGLPF